MQNPKHIPYAHFKSPLLYDWCMFIEFHPSINILSQVGNLNPQYFCQINYFTMRLWHFNKVHFAESSKKDKK